MCTYIHTYKYYLTHKLELELELAFYLELELHLEAQEQGEETATSEQIDQKTEKWRMAEDGKNASSSGARAGFCV